MTTLNTLLKPITGPLEKTINSQPVIFSLIILFQGLFAGNAMQIPKRLKLFFRKNKSFRLMSLMLIAFSGTQDIEYALFSTIVFLSFMYAVRTPEEREEVGFI